MFLSYRADLTADVLVWHAKGSGGGCDGLQEVRVGQPLGLIMTGMEELVAEVLGKSLTVAVHHSLDMGICSS
jgi:hypothetical protein